MVGEDLITREQAVARIDPAQLDQLLHPMIDPGAEVEVIATGLNASPGAASGKVVFDANRAEELGHAGEAVILVRWETTPDDIHGLIHAQGVLTAHGGMTSHAAVVARGMGKPCVTGCEALTLDAAAGTATIAGHVLHEGDMLTIDGGTGRVMLGEVPLVPPQINEDFQTILRGRTSCAGCASARMPTRPRTPPRPASSARRASASAGRSTCSWPRTGCP